MTIAEKRSLTRCAGARTNQISPIFIGLPDMRDHELKQLCLLGKAFQFSVGVPKNRIPSR